MAKSKQTPINIYVQVNGTSHTIEVTNKKREYFVCIDGQKYKTFTTGKNSNFGEHHEDFPIEVQGENFILTVRGKKIRLVKEGQYIDNGEMFKPAMPPPKWIWVFVFLHVVFFFAIVGGAIGGAFAAGGAFGCLSISRSGKSITKKILFCSIITIACWIGAILLAEIFVMLIS